MKFKSKLLFFFLIILGLKSYSQTPKYSNEFLSIGIGARSLGMSNSVLTSVNDVSAAYWNPSRLNLIEGDRQLAGMHAEYFAGIAKYDYAALGIKLQDSAALAFSVIRFGVDNIPNTSELIDAQGNIHYDRISSFSATDFAFLISYGKQTKIPNLSVGGSAKIIRRKIGDFAGSWGFGLDFASTYKLDKWTFALLARDVTSTFNAWTYDFSDNMIEVFKITGNTIPENSLEISLPRFLIGIGREFKISESFNLIAETGADITTDRKRNVLLKSNTLSLDPHLGVEVSYKNLIYLRGGLGNFQKETNTNGKMTNTFQTNFGLGIVINKKISIDYALTDIGDNSIALYSNIFSLKFNFEKGSNKIE